MVEAVQLSTPMAVSALEVEHMVLLVLDGSVDLSIDRSVARSVSLPLCEL